MKIQKIYIYPKSSNYDNTEDTKKVITIILKYLTINIKNIKKNLE